MPNEADDNPEMSLFDPGPRTDADHPSRTQTAFQLLNSSPQVSGEITRATLDSWFANFPQKKRRDIRSRFRGRNGPHQGALLELVTHEILHRVGTDVRVDPDLEGKTPDFSTVIRGLKVLVECTVVQDSDARIGATEREDVLKDIIDSAYIGPFDLIWQTLQVGSGQPSARRLRKGLTKWTESINHEEALQSFKDGGALKSWVWSDQGWRVAFFLGWIDEKDGRGSIGAEISQVLTVKSDVVLWNALERKAEKYKSPQAPYVVVVGDNTGMPNPEFILGALFGPKNWAIGKTSASTIWLKERLFGSPSKPRNRHVSAVLYKRLKNAWSICDSDQQWQLWHHPEAEKPLTRRLFPFALERFFEDDGTPSAIQPSRTLNDLLGLLDPWPGDDP